MDGGTLALAGGAGTSVQMNGNFSLSAEGELKLDLSEFGVLTNGMTVLSTTGLSNITSIQASFADGVGGTISLSQNGRELIYTEIPMLLWAGGASGAWGAENIWTDGGTPATYTAGHAVSFTDQAGVPVSSVQLDSEVSPLSVLVRNSTTRYEFAGTGALTNTSVVKEGTGTLVIGSASCLLYTSPSPRD